MFISVMAAIGLTVLIKATLSTHALHQFQFLCLLLLAMLTSRLKLKLPGSTGSMSVNLPFLFLAIVQLSLLEAAVVAFASTLVQSLPKRWNPLKLVRVLFNVSTVTTATGFAYVVFHNPWWRHGSNGSLSLLLAAGTYFFANTVPVATIISLTERANLVRTWSGIVHLSFPYYVAGTGITSIAAGDKGHLAWALLLAVVPVTIGIYRSYRIYFGGVALVGQPVHGDGSPALAKRKAAGAG